MEAVLLEASSGTNQPHKNGRVPIQVHSANGDSKMVNSDLVVDKDGESNSLLGRKETTVFNMQPANAVTVDVKFEKVTYTATEGSLFKGKVKKRILHEINGRFPPGQLIAIMGPSGAGKSTLLNVLSGYSIQGVGGKVLINGNPRKLKPFRRLSCYITQDDRLQPLLTVSENMHIAADLKLPSSTSQKRKQEIIDEILATLGLSGTKETKAQGLSGGQKKRLSIALELVNNPLVMFLDEPTTGLDSSSCKQCIELLKVLARQGRTIVCTIHQPSASLFEMFDQVYVLSGGRCLYQGGTEQMIQFFEDVQSPCPKFHNPADYVIELACAEYGPERIDKMVETSQNGKSLKYFKDSQKLLECGFTESTMFEDDSGDLQATSKFNQLKVLMRRGYIKCKRDQTLTYLRLAVNALTALMLGTLYYKAGIDGSKVLDNYNLLFSILMHHTFSTMMLTILTFPTEMNILIKEHFNRWYSLKMYYTSITLIDIPLSVLCCVIFTGIIYFMTAQPYEALRLTMFFVTSLMVVFVAQSFGLVIGAYFNVVDGTFLGPTLTVPMMMFAGFGVSLKDLPSYLYWGSYISYLRFGLEGVVGAIYGLDRPTLDCPDDGNVNYCHYKYPKKFLEDVAVKSDQFSNDVIALLLFWFILRTLAFVMLKYKLHSVR
ncbi:ATP-binding cassette subfamily G member 4 [Anthonomus grandis grandis]|uniref:ATP-binding cassette subfamily G member 4 n=1 Tax=Anthonomus grandis grandis TaxID=2921223 RepID=UPI0021667578|nr:ATP-binding cassette subfamily G member 4 [Anthonomus grandis grandis]